MMEEIRNIDPKVIAWYEFKNKSNVLYIGKKEDKIFKYLKEKKINVDINQNKNDYDYLIMIDNYIDENNLKNSLKCLKEDGTILLGFNNMFGISKFLSYDCENRAPALEVDQNRYTSIMKITDLLNKEGFINSHIYIPFPNINRVDMICTDKVENLSDKLDKYFVEYDNNMTVLAREIDLLRRISLYNKDLLINLANSYFMEVSKKSIETDVKYVSYNNYRKEEYQLITVIKEDIVEKKPVTQKAINNIKRIGKNLEYLKEYDIEILDKYQDGELYSDFVKGKNTFDIELSKYVDNEQELINSIQNYKNILLKNSKIFDKKMKKELNDVLKNQSEEVLNKFNFLEYAFYDMVPKNCFLIDGRYYFFDQEWMEKYLPVEFILYRSIINSYDLVRKIDVNMLLEKLGLLKFKELFDEIDAFYRNRIIDKDNFKQINKEYKKMHDVLYEKKVLEIKNKELQDHIKNQEQYIKELQEDS